MERSQERLLGEIDTRIAGMQYHDPANPLPPAGQVNLEREPDNPHDGHAIRVENAYFEPVGHVPRRIARWLAPLIDAGKIRVDACTASDTASSDAASPDVRDIHDKSIILSVFLCPRGGDIFEPRRPHTVREVLHEVIRRAYQDVQSYDNPQLINDVAESLKLLGRQELLPETYLLLALMPGLAREARMNHSVESLAAMRELLGQVTIGEPLHCHNLTLFPLNWPQDRRPPYALLSEAVEHGEAAVEEVSEAGDVPNLCVVNRGCRPLLVVEGEILVGAKQNRVTNTTVLVAAESTFTLPVSCVEQGRWRHESRHLQARFCAPPSLRSRKMRAVSANRSTRGSAESDQSEVWNEVAAAMDDVHAASPTESLTDAFAATDAEIRRYRQKLMLPDGTAGVVAVQGDRVVALDLFDSSTTMATFNDRLLGAYVFDALRDRKRRRRARRELVETFLDKLGAHARPRVPALGLGHELEVAGDGVLGCALLYDGGLCHLAAFGSPP